MFIHVIIIFSLLTGCATKMKEEKTYLDQFRNVIENTEYQFIEEKKITKKEPFICYKLEKVETCSVEQKVEVIKYKETSMDALPVLVLLPVAIVVKILFNHNIYIIDKKHHSTSIIWEEKKEENNSEPVKFVRPLPNQEVTFHCNYACKDNVMVTDNLGILKKDLRGHAYTVMNSVNAPGYIHFTFKFRDKQETVRVPKDMFLSIYAYWSNRGFDFHK